MFHHPSRQNCSREFNPNPLPAASPNFSQQPLIVALDLEKGTSAYLEQLRDTSSQVHARLLRSQRGPKPPRISSATITNTSGLSGAPGGTPVSTEIRRSEVTCPKRTSSELQHHRLQSTATTCGLRFLRRNISAMLS